MRPGVENCNYTDFLMLCFLFFISDSICVVLSDVLITGSLSYFSLVVLIHILTLGHFVQQSVIISLSLIY